MRPMENDTSGGSRDTEVNELAANPTTRSPTRAATATTPLGNAPNAWRNRPASRLCPASKGTSPGTGLNRDDRHQLITQHLQEAHDLSGHRPVLNVVEH